MRSTATTPRSRCATPPTRRWPCSTRRSPASTGADDHGDADQHPSRGSRRRKRVAAANRATRGRAGRARLRGQEPRRVRAAGPLPGRAGGAVQGLLVDGGAGRGHARGRPRRAGGVVRRQRSGRNAARRARAGRESRAGDPHRAAGAAPGARDRRRGPRGVLRLVVSPVPLAESIRGGPPREFLVSGAYHTPSGHLHLGHLGGPFLSADVLARHLATLGHTVTTITSTDAREGYVLLTAELEGRSPQEVARDYYLSARDTLEAFDLHYDTFIDFSSEPWATLHREQCHAAADEMTRRGRAAVETVRLPRSRRSGRFVIGPFALGSCPSCGAAAAGTSCESCGMWFGPGDLRGVRPRLPDDGDLEWEAARLVYLSGGPAFSTAEVERRFPPGYADLLDRYVAFNGSRIHVTHPLGWGTPWRAHELGDESVHVSYGTGSCAATVVTGMEYQTLAGGGPSPFSRASGVTTVLTGGYDAALPCMMVLALTDAGSDFDPYRHHVLSRFMLLDGRKFSTTAGHAIRGSTYIEAGLDPDAFRLYAARLFSPYEEGDFVPEEFARWTSDLLAGRLEPAVSAALASAEPEPLSGAAADAVRGAMGKLERALAVPGTDLRRAAEVVEEWAVAGYAGAGAYWWLKALAVLAYPFMPRWGTGLWRALGADGDPSLVGFEAGDRPRPERYSPLPKVGPAELARLRGQREEAHA